MVVFTHSIALLQRAFYALFLGSNQRRNSKARGTDEGLAHDTIRIQHRFYHLLCLLRRR